MKFITTLAAVLTLALFAGACGGDDDSSGSSAADQALIDAIAVEIEADAPPVDLDIDYDANCMAAGVVSALGGADAIEEKYGITAADITAGSEIEDLGLAEDEALDAADAMLKCTDFTQVLLSSFGEDLGEDQASCLADLIDGDTIKKVVAAGFMGDAGSDLEQEATGELFAALGEGATKCDLDL